MTFGLDDEDRELMNKATQEVKEICEDNTKIVAMAKEVSRRMKNVPQSVKEKSIKENLVLLTIITSALASNLEDSGIKTTAGAMAMSQALAMVFLLGVEIGMEQDVEIPDSFKDAFKET